MEKIEAYKKALGERIEMNFHQVQLSDVPEGITGADLEAILDLISEESVS